ncbi:Putative peptidoglycan binding domain-containing protein [Streptomyces sp. cf386]|uniref:peptidoglycan-binding domain-containing protein n=1 Tax=Streptomyces sp. cf386 TaxID=1761904 RepID=UPI0008871FAF|nr:peptidoglycan-binding domain-containing protein [Streptomyces sp. cf386]SDN01710.1 Putative peptidoglycan binding domain-containing protein [Streptomyces sp. cf386]
MPTRRWKPVLGVLAAGLSTVLIAAPAQAVPANSGAYGTSFVDGAGGLTDDFGDHFSELGHSLCNGCADSNTDIVLMWQAILAAEGLLGLSDIDGRFGSVTAAATKQWQSRYGLTADGWVGDGTWSAADNRMKWTGQEGQETATYDATGDGSISFERGNSYSYTDYGDSGAYRITGMHRGSHGRWFGGGTRIQFHSRTVTVTGSW